MTTDTMTRTLRYTVTPGSTVNRATLTVGEDGPLGEAGDEREFWAPDGGGYLREITERRPGTLGFQVCDWLAHTGSALWIGEGHSVARVVRYEAKRAVRRV